jgi:hypothetical protein
VVVTAHIPFHSEEIYVVFLKLEANCAHYFINIYIFLLKMIMTGCQWHTPVVVATQETEAEAGGSLEFRSSRPA